MNNQERIKTLPEQLQLLYSSCVTEIASFKQQQWSTTNYALLVYAAVVSISKTIKSLNDIEWFLLFAVSAGSLGCSLFIIRMLDQSIHTRRERLTQIRKHFADEFMIAWGCGKPLEEIVDDPNKKSRLDWFFYSVLILGFLVTIWLLARQLCAS